MLINELLGEPVALMRALVDAGLIVAGRPEDSPFFALLTSAGPMFGVFSPTEQEVCRDWVRSLVPAPTPVAPVPSSDPGAEMIRLVDELRARQEGVPAHAAMVLSGPDPADPTALVEHPVSWWFAQSATSLLSALRTSANGWLVPGDPERSRFVTELVRGEHAMARALAEPAGDGGRRADVAIAWISAGCPLPGDELAAVRPLTLLSPAERARAHPTGAIHGTGSVH